MIELTFGLSDVARMRFAVSPVTELVWSAIAYRKPERHWLHRRWRDETAARLDTADVQLLLALTSGRTYLPDFLTPAPDKARPLLAEELAQIEATPPDLAAAQVRMIHTATTRPPAVEKFLTRPGAGLRELADQMHRYFELALAPHWSKMLGTAERDIQQRCGAAAAEGWPSLLTGLHPRLGWDGQLLRVPLNAAMAEQLQSQAMVLIPCSFVWPGVYLATFPSGVYTIAYPPHGVGRLWEPVWEPSSSPLAALLGPSRAAVLTSLQQPRTTTELARLLALAPSTVSHHLSILVASGLALRQRERDGVHYLRTYLGDEVMAAGTASTRV
ncbi:MAG TPA: winged helix-turn-helix domain-containing protein [Nonomuraea sp.]|nr:winged helix-turn-helix domain-containing protein [Nonomuraea sp.]